MKQFFPLVFLVLLASCADNKPTGAETNKPPEKEPASSWDPLVRQTNEMECIAGVKVQYGEEKAMKYCRCMMDKLEAKYPNADSASAMPDVEMSALSKECLK